MAAPAVYLSMLTVLLAAPLLLALLAVISSSYQTTIAQLVPATARPAQMQLPVLHVPLDTICCKEFAKSALLLVLTGPLATLPHSKPLPACLALT